jgi:WD40 repeat protein
MSRIFLSHSSANNAEAIAVRGWMLDQGWQDVFLDLDPDRGLKAGQRWQDALKQAAERCEMVIFLISPAWAASKWCLAEFLLAKNLNKRIFAAIVQPTPFDDMPVEMTAEWQVVDLTAGTRDYKSTVTLPPGTTTASVEFGNEGLHRLSLGLREAGLDPSYFAWPPGDDPDRSPYPGLRALEAEDAGIFFGREAPTVLALDRLRGRRDAAPPRLLVIQGASGAGKSSFLRAGLIPRLKRDDAHFLPLPIIRPEMAVISGGSGLIQTIEQAFKAQGRPVNRGDVAASIEGGASNLLSLLARLVDARGDTGADGKAPPSLVLSVDQGEELFLAEGAKEARPFLLLLKELALASTPNLIILFTIRSDSYERLQTAPELEGVRQEAFPLPPMPSGAFKSIIERPAERLQQGSKRKLAIEPALTDQLLVDIEGGSGSKDALPLLAFTLERLYRDYGGDGDLTLDEYKIKLKGIEGSIQAAVDAALRAADADPNIPKERVERMTLLRRAMIPALARIDPETRTYRRRVARLSEIPKESRGLIDCLVQARLLVTDEIAQGDKRETTLEPAHEALLRQWNELEGWLKDETADLLALGALQQAAQDWIDKGRSPNWLNHTAGRLEDAERLRERQDFVGVIKPNEQAYLQACRVQENERRDRELETQKRAARNARTGLAAAVVLLVLAAGAAWYAFQQKGLADLSTIEAKTQAQNAERSADEARKNAAEAQRQKAAAENQAARQLAAKLAAQSKVNLDLHAPHNLLLALESIAVTRAANAFSPIESVQLLTDLLSETGGVPLEHADKVSAVEFSRDDRRVATLSGGLVQLWDSKMRGAKPSRLRADAPVRGFAFRTDGRTLATVGDGSAVSLWNVDSPEAPPRSLPTAGGPWDYVSFSKDGRWLATASRDGKRAQLWLLSADNAEPATWVLPHRGAVNSLAFSADGKWLATGSDDHFVRMWNLSATNPAEGVKELDTDDNVFTVAFSPDGKWLASGGMEKYFVHLWRTSAPEQEFAMHVNQWVRALVFSPDGRWLATPSQYDAVLWDLNKPDPSKDPMTLPGHRNTIADITFSPDGTWFASSSYDNTVRLWNVRDRTPSAVLRGHEAPILKLAFSHDGRRLASASDDATVRLWSVASPNALPVILRTPEASGKLYAFSLKPDEMTSPPRLLLDQQYPPGSATIVSPDGNWVAQLAKDGIDGVDLISTSGAPHYGLRHPGIWAAPTFSRDSRWLATGGFSDGSIRLWDVKAPNPAAKPVVLRSHRYIRSLDFSADRRLVSGARDGTAQVLDLTDNGQAEKRTPLVSGDVKSVAISPDGRFVVAGSWAPDNVIEGNDARIWDLSSPATPKNLAVLSFQNRVFDVDISADSRWAAAGSWDGTSQLLDLTKGDAKPFTLSGHTGRMITIAFSPDNRWLATANDDRNVRLWSLDEADPSSASVALKADFGLGVSFSPDGRWVATSQTEYRTNPFTPDSQSLISSSDQIHLYLTKLDDLVSLACSTAGRRAFASDADKALYSGYCPNSRAP